MGSLSYIIVTLVVVGFAHADMGGPYEGVVDIQEEEHAPIFAVSNTKKPLDFYLRHIPQLNWSKELNEPESYSWVPIEEYHASFRKLGVVRGHQILELRYISRERISKGLDFADILIILAKGQDTSADANLCSVVYYTSGGEVYNHTAEYHREGHKYGAVVVTRHYSGNGGHRDLVGIRGTEDFKFERFSPATKEAEQNVPPKSDRAGG